MFKNLNLYIPAFLNTWKRKSYSEFFVKICMKTICHLLSSLICLLGTRTMLTCPLHHCWCALYRPILGVLLLSHITTDGMKVSYVPCLSFVPIQCQPMILNTQLDTNLRFRGSKTSLRILAPAGDGCLTLNTLPNFSVCFLSVKWGQFYLPCMIFVDD